MRYIHKQVKRSFVIIQNCVVDFIISKDGHATFEEVEKHTGLDNINVNLTASVLGHMNDAGLVKVTRQGITGNVKKLQKIRKFEEVHLPPRYNSFWSDNDIVKMATMYVAGKTNMQIAQELERTPNAIGMKMGLARQAYNLIPLIKENKNVRLMASIQVSPKPSK